jgi:hypothetical protein
MGSHGRCLGKTPTMERTCGPGLVRGDRYGNSKRVAEMAQGIPLKSLARTSMSVMYQKHIKNRPAGQSKSTPSAWNTVLDKLDSVAVGNRSWY